MGSSVWSGHLTLGLISMPVKLFSGARSSGISFNMLHRADNSRLKQQYVCIADGQVIDRADVIKGYEFRKDEYITIEPDEIKAIEPASGKTMEILEFVSVGEVDPIYFESSYYVVPDEAGKQPYALLSKALETSGYLGVARLAMHNREYIVLLRPYEGGLMVHTMYYEDEVKKVEGFGKQDIDVNAAQLKVTLQLISALSADWEPQKYTDTFQENLKKLIERKLEGDDTTPPPTAVKKYAVVDIMAAIKQSLAEIEEKKERRKNESNKKAS